MSALGQLHLPQQWPNLRNTGPIYGIRRYWVSVGSLGIIKLQVCIKFGVKKDKIIEVLVFVLGSIGVF